MNVRNLNFTLNLEINHFFEVLHETNFEKKSCGTFYPSQDISIDISKM